MDFNVSLVNLICTPTGSGKTRDEAIRAIDSIKNNSVERVIYLAPRKHLLQQFDKELQENSRLKDTELKRIIIKSNIDMFNENQSNLPDLLDYIKYKLEKSIKNAKNTASIKECENDIRAIKEIHEIVKQNRNLDFNDKENEKIITDIRIFFNKIAPNNNSEEYYEVLRKFSLVFSNFKIELEDFDVLMMTFAKTQFEISPRTKLLYHRRPKDEKIANNKESKNKELLKCLIKGSLTIIDEFEYYRGTIDSTLTSNCIKGSLTELTSVISALSNKNLNTINDIIRTYYIYIIKNEDKCNHEIKLGDYSLTEEEVFEFERIFKKSRYIVKEYSFERGILSGSSLDGIRETNFCSFQLNGSVFISEIESQVHSTFLTKKINSHSLTFKRYNKGVFVDLSTMNQKDSKYTKVIEDCRKLIVDFIKIYTKTLDRIFTLHYSNIAISSSAVCFNHRILENKLKSYAKNRMKHNIRPNKYLEEIVGSKEITSYMKITDSLVEYKSIKPFSAIYYGQPELTLYYIMLLSKKTRLLSATGGIQHINNFCLNSVKLIAEKVGSRTIEDVKKARKGEIKDFELQDLYELFEKSNRIVLDLDKENIKASYKTSKEKYSSLNTGSEFVSKNFSVSMVSLLQNEFERVSPLGDELVNKTLFLNKISNVLYGEDITFTDNNFHKDRLLRIGSSIADFINKGNYNGLFFLNYLLPNKYKDWIEAIEKYLKETIPDFKIKFISVDAKKLAELEDTLNKNIEKGYRNLVFTTYKTLSVGSNIRINIDKFLSRFNIPLSDIYKIKKYDSNHLDIDFAYFEKLTYVIDDVDISDFTLEKEGLSEQQIDRLKKILIQKRLCSFINDDYANINKRNSKSSKEITKIINSNFQKIIHKHIEAADSILYFNAVLKEFIQALGRISRSPNKIKTHVVLDEGIVEQLKRASIDEDYPLSIEQRKVFDFISTIKIPVILHPIYNEIQENLDMGFDGCLESQDKYQENRGELVNKLFTSKEFFKNYSSYEYYICDKKNSKDKYRELLEQVCWPEITKFIKFEGFKGFMKRRGIEFNQEKSRFFIPFEYDKESPKVVLGYLGESIFMYMLEYYGCKKDLSLPRDQFENFDFLVGYTGIDIKSYHPKSLKSISSKYIKSKLDRVKRNRSKWGTGVKKIKEASFIPLFPNEYKGSGSLVLPSILTENNGGYDFNPELIKKLKELDSNLFSEKSSEDIIKSEDSELGENDGKQLGLFQY